VTDDFKRKLEAFENGELPKSEMEDMEKELDKLEKYQEYLEENGAAESKGRLISDEKQKKILRRSKWKARFSNAFTVICIIILMTIVSSVLTMIFYSWGEPDRSEVYGNIIDYTMAVTDPYGGYEGTSTNVKPYFGMEASRDLDKRIGDETVKVGKMKVNFLFALMAYPEYEYYGRISQDQPAFIFPGTDERGISDWDQLEKLPEGTVISAYVSFSKLENTKDVFKLFYGKNMQILWFAVDTGLEENDEWYDGMITDPIGFPDFPIWHDNDMILDSRETEKGIFGSRVISEGYSSPSYEEGDSGTLHTQFLKTLRFLMEHERKVDNLYFGDIRLKERIEFLETNGINHYGVVITGPTNEILKLKDEEWISNLEVDEVGFWNWDNWRIEELD
jgi:hypothetical protein